MHVLVCSDEYVCARMATRSINAASLELSMELKDHQRDNTEAGFEGKYVLCQQAI